MHSVTQLVWFAHGSPVVDDCEDAGGRCYVCTGAATRGKTVQNWLGSNYTDQNRARAPLATHVCEACVFVHSRTSPVLGRPAKEGKSFGGNFRNYSHLYEQGWLAPAFGDDGAQAGNYANASKGQKPLIREFLARHHAGQWFAAIADSGQKHVLPFAPLNGGGSRAGAVIFEEALVHVPSDQSLLDEMTALLTAGVTKDEISRGEYYVRTMRENREAAREFEETHGRLRGSGWFQLAIWLAQRDEEGFAAVEAARKAEKDARREAKKTTRNTRSGDDPRPAKRVSKRSRRATADELLGADTKPVSSGGAAGDDGQRVEQRGSATSPDRGPSQLGFEGFD